MKNALILLCLFTISSCELLDVGPEPIALFDLDIENKGVVILNDLSTEHERVTVDWGDGNVTQRPSGSTTNFNQYAQDGNYTVTLTAYSTDDKKSSSYSQNIAINNTSGTFFWQLQRNLNVQSVRGYVVDSENNTTYLGAVTGYNPNDVDCATNTSSGIKTDLKPGEYFFYANTIPAGNGYWEGNFTVVNDRCVTRRLN